MPGRDNRLVCQHLEGVARDLLRDYPEIIRALARDHNGLYALYRGDRLCYVGLASNLRRRLSQHLRDHLGGDWDRFSLYLTVDGQHLQEMEALFLRISKPQGNRARPRLRQSQDLSPELERRIAASQRQHRDHLLGANARGPTAGEGRERAARTSRLRPAPLAPYVTKRMRIRLRHRGQIHLASVHRDGTIHCQGEAYESPSGAALAVTGVSLNGWQVWQYESGGEWVPLRTLRGQAAD
jgi:hypothetical protein